MQRHSITMLGTGLIGDFYTSALQKVGQDVRVIYSRSQERAEAFRQRWGISTASDELSELGYIDMFADMFGSMDSQTPPIESFYDDYVVNAVMDAAYRSAESRTWEPVRLDWRDGETPRIEVQPRFHDGHAVVKEEILPDGRRKLILSDPDTGAIVERVA